MLVIQNTCAFCNQPIEEVVTEHGLIHYDHDTPSCCDICADIEEEVSPPSFCPLCGDGMEANKFQLPKPCSNCMKGGE